MLEKRKNYSWVLGIIWVAVSCITAVIFPIIKENKVLKGIELNGIELNGIEKYEDDPAATQEIDNYLRQVITAVNNGTVVEHRGGARENSGRKRKTAGEKSVTVSFCCSPEQKAALQEAARTSGMNQSEYILSGLFKS